MSHDLFGERFFSYRKPAWHKLGLVLQQPTLAREALELVAPDLRYTLTEGQAMVEGATLDCPDWKVIVRHATLDDPKMRPMGTVGSGYHLIQPTELADIADSALHLPVETLGILDHGRTLFLTLRLPAFDVFGDPIERYLGVVSPYGGNSSLKAEIWPLRVVCRNTLKVAQSNANERMCLKHDAYLKDNLRHWLLTSYQKAVADAGSQQQLFEHMARRQIRDEVATQTLQLLLPDPPAPSKSRAPLQGNMKSQRLNRRRANTLQLQHEKERARRANWRGQVQNLHQGLGAGMAHVSCHATAFGLYNAVCEMVDHRPFKEQAQEFEVNSGVSRNLSSGQSRAAGRSAMFGAGALLKERALRLCLAL